MHFKHANYNIFIVFIIIIIIIIIIGYITSFKYINIINNNDYII